MSKPLALILKEKMAKFDNFKIEELYYNQNALYNSVTLNDSILNYNMLVIIGQSSDGYSCVGACYKPAVGNLISIKAGHVTDAVIYNKQAVFKISTEKIIESPQNYEIRDNIPYSGNYIRIKAVLGINF